MLSAVSGRRSHPKVSADAPTREQLLPLIQAASNVADHASLRPWRLIELRGNARGRLGTALATAAGKQGKDAVKLASKPLRAELLIAVVASHKKSHKVEDWEQDATAAGVAHTLSLLLTDAGWGVMWRTGPFTRSAPVRELHQLSDREELLGWLYVGRPIDRAPDRKGRIDPTDFLRSL